MLKSKSAGAMGFVGAALAMLLTAGLALLLLSSAVAQAQDDPPPNEAPTVSGVFSDAFDVTMPAAEEQQQATPSGPEPRNVQIVPGDGVVTVTWEASPFYYKERLIEKERIKHALRWWVGSGWANPVGEKGFGPNDGIHVESGVTSYTITGLTNGVAVEANVRAFFGSNYREGAMNKGESSTSSRWVSSGVATPTEPNNAPTVESTISDATIANESGTHQVSHSGVFTDADGDDLTVTATSSDEKVATVSVSADHSTLTVSAKKRGTATVTVTAEDGKGGSVEDRFTVTVKAAPVVASAIADVSELAVEATQKVSMSGVFSDGDGDGLTVTASSSKDSVATVTVAADYSSLTLAGKAVGTATVTVTARDSDGNSISDSFDVTVTLPVQAQQTGGGKNEITSMRVDAYDGRIVVSWENADTDAKHYVRWKLHEVTSPAYRNPCQVDGCDPADGVEIASGVREYEITEQVVETVKGPILNYYMYEVHLRTEGGSWIDVHSAEPTKKSPGGFLERPGIIAGDGQLELSWNAHESDDEDGKPVGYRVGWHVGNGEYEWADRPGAGEVTLGNISQGPVLSGRMRYTITGLTNGQMYEVRIYTYLAGRPSWSDQDTLRGWPKKGWTPPTTPTPTTGESKVLTVTPSSPTREYGGTDDLSYTVSGLATGDTAAAVVTGELSRASGDDAGDYAIGMGTLAIASAHAQKYELPSAPAITTYRITPRAITSVSGVTVESRPADGSTDATFDTGSADGTGVLASELADFRAGGLVVSGAFPAATTGTHDIAVTYSLQDHGSFKAANYSLTHNSDTLRGELTAAATAVTAVDLMLPPCTPTSEATPEPSPGVIAFVMCDDDLAIESVSAPSNITLIPAFSPDRRNYTVVVADEIERLQIMGRFKAQRHQNTQGNLENPGYAIAFLTGESTEALRRNAAWSDGTAHALATNSAEAPRFQRTLTAQTINLSPGVTTITVGALKWVTNWGCRSAGPVVVHCSPDEWGEKVTINGYRLHLVWRSPETPLRAPEDPKPARSVDYDTDDDGLIEVSSLAQLDAMRWDSNGDGYSDHGGPLARGFPNALQGMGCPAAGCKGYELAADLDLDTNGNGRADAGDDYWNKGHGWLPIGTDTEPFRAIFEGNGHAIRNLHIFSTKNTQMRARRFTAHVLTPTAVGLFQQLAQGGIIRNVGLEDADVSRSFACSHRYADVYPDLHPRSKELLCKRGPVGGLLGVNHGVVSGSYVTGAVTNEITIAKNVTRFEWIVVGGLAGVNSSSGVIAASYSSARVSGRMALNGHNPNGGFVGGLVGGLAGSNDGKIIASYAGGDASMAGDRRIHVGGLAGMSTGSVTASYAFGEVSGIGPYVGGLVGRTQYWGKSGSVSDGYWDTQTSGRANGAGGIGKTTAELQAPTAYTGIYADWNVDLDGDGTDDDPWNFGTTQEYPVLKHGGMDTADQRSHQLPATPGAVQDLRLGVSVNNVITVAWREPRSGGAPDKYLLQVKNVDGVASRSGEIAASRRNNGGQLSFLFDDMESGATYEVGVQSVNRAGSGTWTRGRITVPDATVLSGLTISTGSLGFASATLSYHVTVGKDVGSVTLTPTPFNSKSTVTVGGKDPSTAVALRPGNNVIYVVVTSPDGAATRTYTVTVLRKIPGKPGVVRNIRVAANWREDRSHYRIEIRWDAPAGGGTPEGYYVYWNNDQNGWASSGLTRNGQRFYAHSSSGGSTATIEFRARAKNGYGYGPYTTIRFAVPSPASLGGLAISDGSLTFSPNTTAYLVKVSPEVDSVTLTPYLLHHQATVTVNGEDPSKPVELNYGDNVINVVVTAADGATTKTYVVKFVRLGLASAQLTDLTISAGYLNFQPQTITYTVNVPHVVDSVTFTPTIGNSDSVITVKGQDPETPVELDYGNNIVNVAVTSADGQATTTYTVTVVRLQPTGSINLIATLDRRATGFDDAALFSLSLPQGVTMEPEFRPDRHSYRLVVPDDMDQLTFAGRFKRVKLRNFSEAWPMLVVQPGDLTRFEEVLGGEKSRPGDHLSGEHEYLNQAIVANGHESFHARTVPLPPDATTVITVAVYKTRVGKPYDFYFFPPIVRDRKAVYTLTVTRGNPADNAAPTVASAIDDATIVNESGTSEVSLSGVFTDADGDDLTITASSSDEKAATVSVSADYSSLTVTAKARGSATITVTASDGKGGTVEDSFTVTVKAAPVVASAIADVSEFAVDATHKVSLSGVFSDADADSLTVTASSSKDAVATVSVAADQSGLTLTGKAAGTATITVTAQDSDGNSVSEAFDVTVVKANNAPTVASAIEDVTITNESGSSEVSLSGVFTDTDSDDLKITASSSDETVAAVSVAADYSSLTVTAKARGAATITVTASDGNGGSIEDSFTVKVKAAPVVASALSDVSELTISDTHQVSLSGVFSDADFDALTVTASSSKGAVATVSVAADYSGLTLTGKAAGTATITVTAQDSDGNSVSDAFDVTVVKANSAPTVASAINDVTIVKESGTKQVSLSGVFTDADGDSLTITAKSSSESVATVSVSAGHSTLTVTAKAWGSATITVTASDGKGGSVEDSFTVTVKAAPVVASAIADVSELAANATHKVSLSGVFSDADDDSLTVTASSSDEKVTTVSVAADQSGLTLSGKAAGAATVTVTAQDSDGNSVSDAFDVTVIKANSAPTVASAISDATIVNTSGTKRVTLSGVFSDADGDSLTITAKPSAAAVATVSVAADYSTLTVTAKSRGTATITVTASDGTAKVSDTFTVKVKAAPVVVSAIADVSELAVEATHKVSLSGVFTDADGDSLTVTASSSKDTVAAVSVAADQSGLTLTGKAAGTATVTVTARDSDGNSVSDTFDVTVVRVNSAPTVASAIGDATIVNESGTKRVSLSGVFTDADSDSLTVTASSSDEKVATVSVSTDHAALTVTAKKRGTATVTVTASDGNGGSVKDSFTVTVKAAPAVASAIADISELAAGVSQEISLSGVFSDADGDALTLSAVSSSSAVVTVLAQLDPVTGSATAITVTGVSSGTATVTVTARDTDGNSVNDAFDVTVPVVEEQQAVELPGPVVSLALTASAEDSVTVSWSAPDTGGAPQGYIVHIKRKGGGYQDTRRPGADRTALTFSGLNGGATYDVWVRAQNETGKGERVSASITLPQPESEDTLPAVLPGPVTGLDVTADGNALTVSWSAPETGGTPDGYIVHVSPEDGGKGRTKTPKAKKTQMTFENLDAGRTYAVWVRAQNEAGKGERVHASITLPEQEDVHTGQ